MTKGDIITIIGINSFGMCNRAEFKYYGTINGLEAVTENRKGARKKFVMPDLENNRADALVFTVPVPLTIEGEVEHHENGMTIRRMTGDCTIRFMNKAHVVKTFIEENNLNKNFTRYDAVMTMFDDTVTPVYPETPTDSHPVQVIRDKQTV